MSEVARSILMHGFDYEALAVRRRENYARLAEEAPGAGGVSGASSRASFRWAFPSGIRSATGSGRLCSPMPSIRLCTGISKAASLKIMWKAIVCRRGFRRCRATSATGLATWRE